MAAKSSVAVSASATPTDSINFFRVCRIVLDDCPNVLRDVFKQAVSSKFRQVWSDNRAAGQWLVRNDRWNKRLNRQQIQLLEDGNSSNWDPTLLFHVLLYSSLCLLADDIKVQATLQHGSCAVNLIASVPLHKIMSGVKLIFDCGQEMFFSEVVSVKGNVMHIKYPANLQSQTQTVNLLLCTSEWRSVEHLSFLRNEKFAHCKTASTTTSDLHNLVLKVERLYNDLKLPQVVINRMKAIETEEIATSKVFQQLQDYQQKWMSESQRTDEVNKKVLSIQGNVLHLQSDVAIIRDQDIPKLKEDLCTIDKGTKLVADSLNEQHRILEEKVDLNVQHVQSLDQDVRVAISNVQQFGAMKLVQTQSEKKLQEHGADIVLLKKRDELFNIVQLDVKKLHTKQTCVAARVSDNVQMVKQLSSQHDETKQELKETKAIVQKVAIETERQFMQLSHREETTAQHVAVLDVKVTEMDDDVQRIKGEVEQIHHKTKTAENEPLRKLNPSHFESDIQYYLSKHHAGTRQWIFDQISARHSKQSRKNICVVTGNPGMGKSVIAAKLCRFYLEKGTLAGCFFFQHHKARRSTPRMLIQTLAYHFCSSISEYRDIIKDILVDTDIQEMNCAELFTCLILEPLSQLRVELYLNKYIVIDALDECAFEFHSELMKLIIREFIRLPAGISVVITTRPDKEILQELKTFRPLIELNPSDPRNIEDITLYLSDILRDKIDPNEYDAGLELLVKKSEGMFLYFHYAIDTLLEQTRITLAMLESLLPDGIDDYYDQNFKRLRSALGHDRYHALLEAAVACRTDLPQEIVTSLLSLSTAEESASITRGISVLLPLCNGHFHMFHKSIRDWLVSKELAGSLVVDPILGHRNLAILCRSIFCNIKANRDTLAIVLASPEKKYAIENIAYHLCNSNEKDGIELLVSTIVNLQFMYYRLLLSKGTAANLLDDYKEVNKLLTHVVLLRTQVEHSIAFVKRYAQQISEMPYLILQCALNEPNTVLDFLEVEKYIQDAQHFFSDMKMYFEISNKNQILGTASMSYVCKNDVTYCIQSVDKKFIICSDVESNVYIWIKETAELVHKQKSEDHYFVVLCINNLSISSDGKIAFGSIHSALSLDGSTVGLIPSAKSVTNTCVFSWDNKKLLAWSYYGNNYFKFAAEVQLQCNPMYVLELWDLQTCTCQRLESTSKASRPSSACFSNDDSYVLCGHYDGTIRQWESITGTLVAILHSDGTVIKKLGAVCANKKKEDQISHVSCSPNGYYIAACCSKGIVIWDALSLACLQVLTLEPATTQNKGRFLHCSFSSDSCYIVAGSINGYLKVWKKEASGGILFKSEIQVKLVEGISQCILSPILDECLNVTCGIGNAVNMYSYSSLCHANQAHEHEKQVVHPGGVAAASFIPETLKAVTCGNKSLYLWDVPTHSILSSAAGVIGSLIRLSSDGNWLLSYGDGVYIQVWDTKNLSCQSTLICSQKQSSPPGSRGPNDSSPNDICHCAISNTGLAVGGTGNGALFLWYGEKRDNYKLLRMHQSLITFCEFLPDGSRLLTADMDGHITMWQLLYVNGNLEVNSIQLKSHKDSVEQVCFYPKGEPHRIISCSMDKNLHLYDGQSGDLIKKMKGHSVGVSKLAVSFDRNVIASGDDRGQIILWDPFTGVMKMKFPHITEGIVQNLQFLCNSSFTCTLDDCQDSCAGNIIRVYDTATGLYVSCLTLPTRIIAVSASIGTEQTWILCGAQDETVKFVKVHKLDKNE